MSIETHHQGLSDIGRSGALIKHTPIPRAVGGVSATSQRAQIILHIVIPLPQAQCSIIRLVV